MQQHRQLLVRARDQQPGRAAFPVQRPGDFPAQYVRIAAVGFVVVDPGDGLLIILIIGVCRVVRGGMAAVFGGATNTLFAPILVGAEIFGFDTLPAFFIVCTLAYACNGGQSIYAQKKIRLK